MSLSPAAIILFGLCLALVTVPAGGNTQKPVGTPLVAPEVTALRYFGPGDGESIVRVVPVTGEDFKEALQVDTMNLNPGQGSDQGLSAPVPVGLKKGDVIWISFKARCLETKKESGEAAFELRVDQLVNGQYKWPPYLDRGISFGQQWTEVSMPSIIGKDVAANGMRLILTFDSYAQRFEIGPITFLNCGSDVQAKDLPRSKVRYGGSEPDAPWRKQAAADIEKYRKSDLQIKVQNADGNAVGDAKVSVRMKRLDFLIGTAISSRNLLDDRNPRYRETVAKYFNHVVFENEMKWPAWANPKHSPAETLRALDWLREREITARGHVMVWPSWGKMPRFLGSIRTDKEALRNAVFSHIKRQTEVMKGKFVQWDVTNEVFAHHDLVDLLGREEMIAWYKAAKAGEPDALLFYNDYTMFHAASAGQDHFYQTLDFLKRNGAPVEGIGEQAHIGGSPPGIPLVLERLEWFAGLGLPITITEFDMSVNDEEFMAAYMNDFMIALFSNPAAVGFVQWGFWEKAHWIPRAAMWNGDWTIRKHGHVFTDMVTKTWRTDADGRTDVNGSFVTRGFNGDYEVTVTHAGKTKIQFLTLDAKSGIQSISLP